MGKKKKKEKKTSAKKEKYAKFHKDKSTNFQFKETDRTEDDVKFQHEEESKLERFFKFRRAPPEILPSGCRVDKRNFKKGRKQ